MAGTAPAVPRDHKDEQTRRDADPAVHTEIEGVQMSLLADKIPDGLIRIWIP